MTRSTWHVIFNFSKALTFPTKEEVVDEREDEGDAFYRILQVAQHPIPIEGEGNQNSREGVQSAYFDQATAGYLDSHAVWY